MTRTMTTKDDQEDHYQKQGDQVHHNEITSWAMWAGSRGSREGRSCLPGKEFLVETKIFEERIFGYCREGGPFMDISGIM